MEAADIVDRVTTGLLGIVTQAEQELLTLVATRLMAGQDAPQWAQQRLASLGPLMEQLALLIEGMTAGLVATAGVAVGDAVEEGARVARAEVAALLTPTGQATAALAQAAGTAATARIIVDQARPELQSVLSQLGPRVLRQTEDTYRATVATVAQQVTMGTATRRQATQQALDRWADQGVAQFVDRSGRRWDVASYAEMATRATTMRAAVDAHTATLAGAGLDLVWVSDVPHECRLCRPWEGKVLTISGSSGARMVEVQDMRTGRPRQVRVAGSLDEARRAGLAHPNCRHAWSAYLPGATRLPTDTADPGGEQDRARQRQIERHARHWARRLAVAQTPEAKALAKDKVRGWRAEARRHAAATGQRRKPERERIGTAR